MRRVLALVQQFHSGTDRSMQDLADSYDVSVRTIRRDMQLLREFGVITSSAVKPAPSGSTKQQEAATGGPLLSELAALTIATNLSEGALPRTLRKSLHRLLEKLLVEQPAATRQRMGELAALLKMSDGESAHHTERLEWLPPIYEAMIHHQTLRIWIRDEHADKASTLLLIPSRIQVSGERWSLIGYLLGGSESPPIDFERIERLEPE